jgi:hypothetical protein
MTLRQRLGQFLVELGNNQPALVLGGLALAAIIALLIIFFSGWRRSLKAKPIKPRRK